MEEPYVALIPKACTLAEKEVISVEEMFDHDTRVALNLLQFVSAPFVVVEKDSHFSDCP